MAPCIMEHLTISHFLGMLVVMLAVAKAGGFLRSEDGTTGRSGRADRWSRGGTIVAGTRSPRIRDDPPRFGAGGGDPAFRHRTRDRLGPAHQGWPDVARRWPLSGVALPFALGFAACMLLGFSTLVSVMAGATLTATSVGITARVLSDLGRLHDPEGQIILGAAVIDDILGLMILTVVAGLTEGKEVSFVGIVKTTASALGFLLASLVIGKLVVPVLFRWAGRIELPGTATAMALMIAFGMAWLAEECGSAMIIGAFAAGLLVVSAPQTHEIERGITEIGHFFVPLFFVAVGASVDLSALDPFQPASRFALLTGGVLIVVGVAGKLAAGYAPFWFRGNKTVIGVGMVPRGEVGLIFAQMGLATGCLRRRPFRRSHPDGDRDDSAGPRMPQVSAGARAGTAPGTTRSRESKTSSPKLGGHCAYW